MTNKERESDQRKKEKRKINKISRIYMCFFLNFIVGISDYRTEETGKPNSIDFTNNLSNQLQR